MEINSAFAARNLQGEKAPEKVMKRTESYVNQQLGSTEAEVSFRL